MFTFRQKKKNYKANEETGKCGPFRKLPWERPDNELNRKPEKAVVLKILQELREVMDKMKKIMYEQNVNINEEIDKK